MADPQCRWTSPNDWTEWSRWLAAGLHARNRWRLPLLLVGILFAATSVHGLAQGDPRGQPGRGSILGVQLAGRLFVARFITPGSVF
jgi:hypothetical protein